MSPKSRRSKRFELRAVEVKKHLVIPIEEDRDQLQTRFGLPFRVYTPAARKSLEDLCSTNKIKVKIVSWTEELYPSILDQLELLEPSLEVKGNKFLCRADNLEQLQKLEQRIRKGFRQYSFRTEIQVKSRRNKHAMLAIIKFDPNMDTNTPEGISVEQEARLKLGDILLMAQVVDKTSVMPKSLHWRASSSLDDNEVSILWNTSHRITPQSKESIRAFAFQLLNIVGTAPRDEKK